MLVPESIPKGCTIMIGERTTVLTEYSGFFTLSNGVIYVQTSSDVLETFHSSDKTFSNFEIKGINGFMPAPGVNSLSQYNALFN